MKNFNYECEGQLNLIDYLDSIKLPDYCEDCIFLENYNCGLKKGQCIEGSKSFKKSDGWHRIKKNPNNTVSGKWPTCDSWQEVSTFHYDEKTGKFALTNAQGKDKTFKWAKDDQVDGDCIAWKYKKGECF